MRNDFSILINLLQSRLSPYKCILVKLLHLQPFVNFKFVFKITKILALHSQLNPEISGQLGRNDVRRHQAGCKVKYYIILRILKTVIENNLFL